MAISARAVGSWAAANATTQTVTLPTHAAGDMLLVRVAFKHATMPTTVTCNTSGWAKLGQYNNGTTVSGNGTGSVIVAVFYKEATSAAETNPVITYHASVAATPSAAVAVSYQKAADETWVTPEGAGGSIGTSTALSATITSHISTTAGDLVDFFHSQGDNNTLTVPTFTQAGLTLGTVVEYPATALSSATSNDIDADGGYRAVTSGTSSAAAVVTGTANAGDQGSAWTTRLRVEAGATQKSGTDSGAGTDAVASMAAAVTGTDSGAGTEASALAAAIDTRADSGAATDTASTSQSKVGSDSGVGLDGGSAGVSVTDTFTGSGALESHTPDSGGGTWDSETDGMGAVLSLNGSGSVEPSGWGPDGSGYVDGLHSASIGDGWAQASVIQLYDDLHGAGPVIRGIDFGNNYHVRIVTGVAYLYRETGNSYSSLGTIGGSGNWYRLSASGVSPTSLSVERRSDSSFTGTPTYSTSDNTTGNQTATGKAGIATSYDDWASPMTSRIGDFGSFSSGSGGAQVDAAITVADSGTATDVVASRAYVLAESGAATDTASVSQEAIEKTASDSGTATDAAALAAGIAAADAGAGADASGAPGAAIGAVLDSGAALDTVAALAASLVGSETGAGTDGGALVSVPVASADSGAGTDTATLAAALLRTDAGTGTDTSTAPAVDLLRTDAGTGTDAATVATQTEKVASDSGTATDTAAAPAVALLVTESAAASDAGTLGTPISTSESAIATDAVADRVLVVSDAAVATDAVAVLARTLAEAGVAADAVQTVAALIASSDSGAGTDLALLGLSVLATDSGVATDARQSLLVEHTGADSGTGTEAVTGRALGTTESGVGADIASLAALLVALDSGAASDVGRASTDAVLPFPRGTIASNAPTGMATGPAAGGSTATSNAPTGTITEYEGE